MGEKGENISINFYTSKKAKNMFCLGLLIYGEFLFWGANGPLNKTRVFVIDIGTVVLDALCSGLNLREHCC